MRALSPGVKLRGVGPDFSYESTLAADRNSTVEVMKHAGVTQTSEKSIRSDDSNFRKVVRYADGRTTDSAWKPDFAYNAAKIPTGYVCHD